VIDVEDGLRDVELRGERLAGADLAKLQATSAVLVDCDLSAVMLAEADLWRVELRGCRMSGVALDGARLRDVKIIGCKLDTASLRSVQAERVVFDDCVLRDADLSKSRWKDTSFLGCDLDGAVVVEADLRGTRVHRSTIERVIGADSLRGIVISPDQALNLGLRVLDALGITSEDEDDGGADEDGG
jgi:uncharacterized protein YjbI with pentapeptide repeats